SRNCQSVARKEGPDRLAGKLDCAYCRSRNRQFVSNGAFPLLPGLDRCFSMKILLADDHLLTLRGIRSVLEHVADIEIVGEARSGAEVLELVARSHPDMVLMDV